ncbi:MAG: acetyl-CoA carboxylase carboxyltransferase subunit alpha [Deltaproteobacteria bacterium]|nr:acetyl-CoA carboxylase carboxyltransferase subunit alpha [Deltaproteobacteria bacterium]
MQTQYLDFERPLVELEQQIDELKQVAGPGVLFAEEIGRLEERARKLQIEIFNDLDAWQKVQLSRHPNRPYMLDYVERLMTDFIELHGDRLHGEDRAIVAGLAKFGDRRVMVIGHQKGRNTKENLVRNFGMANPEGYRKARRLFQLADRFGLPILTLIDTPGAYPGIGAEERGQAEAIAQCLVTMAALKVPVIATVIGEGGSGGALALGVANRVLMLEYAIYSVISPEGCASILWKDQSKAAEAARQLRITAADLHRFGLVDAVIEEPAGGAHRDYEATARKVGAAIGGYLDSLSGMTPDELVGDRYDKFRAMGVFETAK